MEVNDARTVGSIQPRETVELGGGAFTSTSHHAKGGEVKLLEVTPEKKLVWVHRDARSPGIHHFHILDTDGERLRGRPLR